MKKRVCLGLSGGVDSAVALSLLIKEGYEVVPVFMRNWDSALNNDILGQIRSLDDVCEQESDYLDAIEVCKKYNLELKRVDFIEEYYEMVFKYFLKEYENFRTPNPDVMCNNEIKFKAFLNYSKTLDCEYIATGHYAKIFNENGKNVLCKAFDLSKDQSYFLSMLTNKQLENVIFPLANISKKEVREIAKKEGLQIALKKDSTGICFIGERNFSKFLQNYFEIKEGNIVSIDDNKVLKKHIGLTFYTIGQRKGLEIGGSKDTTNAWYVVGKDIVKNELLVSSQKDSIYLYSNKALIKDVVLREEIKDDLHYCAKFRYRQLDVDIDIKVIDETTILVTYLKERAVTKGQVCAIYNNDICVGGGIIDKVYYDDVERMH
jgi:tRNA-specific 2-thiouridylase